MRRRDHDTWVRGLDLATAIGVPATFPPAALQASLTLGSALATRTGNGSELLLAATGRQPLPAEFNLLHV